MHFFIGLCNCPSFHPRNLTPVKIGALWCENPTKSNHTVKTPTEIMRLLSLLLHSLIFASFLCLSLVNASWTKRHMVPYPPFPPLTRRKKSTTSKRLMPRLSFFSTTSTATINGLTHPLLPFLPRCLCWDCGLTVVGR